MLQGKVFKPTDLKPLHCTLVSLLYCDNAVVIRFNVNVNVVAFRITGRLSEIFCNIWLICSSMVYKEVNLHCTCYTTEPNYTTELN